MSKAITEKPNEPQGEWQPLRETAPSLTRVDEPSFGRAVGFVGLMCLALGGTALLLHWVGWTRGIGPLWGGVAIITGMACLLFHAACDGDLQVRRIYGIVGFLWLAAGLVVTLIPQGGWVGHLFLPYGYVCWILGLFFLLPFVRHETEPQWRRGILGAMGVAGAALALVGLVGGIISVRFLMPYGLLLALLGLAYLWALLVTEGVNTDLGLITGWGLGILGALVVVGTLGRAILPSLFHSWGWLGSRPAPYFVPYGLLLLAVGLLYVVFAVGVVSERRLVTLTRRELAAYFYSPIAYLVLFGTSAIGWFQYWFFISQLNIDGEATRVLPEPIVARYLLAWGPVICVIFFVPALTMRLLSEEKRTGTLEVMFTAPLDELSVALSKFLACWAFFMLLWVPWGLFLLELSWEMDQAFEYRPLLNFYLVMAITGAGFVSLGMFFSALTRNQVVAAVLTFALMLTYTFAFLARNVFMRSRPGETESVWSTILMHVSYLDLWISSFEGVLTPQYLVYHLSATVFGIFLTVKVLEARKWL